VKHDGTLDASLDWATKTHAVCVDDVGQIRIRFEIPNPCKSFAGVVKTLGQAQRDGALIDALLKAGLRVGVITPRPGKGLRSRYTGSGTKSDAGDAYLLADVLRTDGHRLAALTRDSEANEVLGAMSRTRKDLL
jgi:hypothetical protein